MKTYLYFIIFSLIFSNEIWSQTETCPQNLNHPNNRIFSQIIGSDTIFREYILHIPQNYDENIPTPLVINLNDSVLVHSLHNHGLLTYFEVLLVVFAII